MGGTSKGCIYLVEDDPWVGRSLERLIRAAGFEVELFRSAEAFLERIPTEHPGCVVLYIQLPELGVLNIQERLEGAEAGLPVIFIAGCGDIPMSVREMKAGAAHFLIKPFEEDRLMFAIGNAVEGSRRMHERFRERAAIQGRLRSLTRRQREVMGLVIAGMLNKQIASEIGTSEKTVKAHRHQVMEKMGVRSVADLVRSADTIGFAPAAQRSR